MRTVECNSCGRSIGIKYAYRVEPKEYYCLSCYFRSSHFRRLLRFSVRSQRTSDEEVIDHLDDAARTQGNADDVGRYLLELACYIGAYREHLFPHALRPAIECMVALGVENIDHFWLLANAWMGKTDNRILRFLHILLNNASVDFFYNHLPAHEALIENLIREVIEEVEST